MTPLKELLTNYKINHQAIPAFNIDSFEIYQAVEAAVADTKLPCLVQLSANEDTFIQAEKLFLLVRKANLEGLPLYLNMDHGHDLNRLHTLVKLGFDMVHFDGSSLDYQTNLSQATTFISKVKTINPNCLAEVEFNKINLVETGVSPESFTNPSQALEFITETKADLFAASIGNLHGVNANFPETIDLALLEKIVKTLPDTFFTLHGGSGISLDQIQSAVNLGIVKININTDLRLKFKESLKTNLNSSPSEKIYDYFNPVITDVKNVIIQKLKFFSSGFSPSKNV
jgi:fructose-bisphosphate aldolase, class II